MIQVYSENGRSTFARALIDSGSEITCIAEPLAKRLQLRYPHSSIPIFGVGQQQARSKGCTNFSMGSRTDKVAKYHVEAYVLEKLSSYTPKCSERLSDWSHIKDLHLADPQYYSNVPVELILGADVYALIIQEGVISGPVNAPVAQRTSLGWILTCASSSNPTAKVINVQCASLDREFYSKNDHFNKKSEAKSMPHLKAPVSKSMQETLVTKDRRSCSNAKCWTQVCLMLQTIFSFFFNVLNQSKSNGNQRKRKTY